MNSKIIDKFYSQKSLYEPVCYLSKDHWVNKNRHSWWPDEKEELYHSEIEDFKFEIGNCDVLLRFYDLNENADLLNLDSKDPTKLYCGRVIKIGALAFDLACFPKGASATYNDWVLFSIDDAEQIQIKNRIYYVVNDLSIGGVIRDPSEITNNKIRKN